jgi:hypothetical protein
VDAPSIKWIHSDTAWPGWSVRRNRSGLKIFAELTTPSAAFRWLRNFLLMPQPPLLFKEGNMSREFAKFKLSHYPLGKRFAKYGLTLHPEKTRLVEFGRRALAQSEKPGGRKPATFDFLGFTHVCKGSRKGKFTVHVRTMRKRFRRSLKAITAWCREHRHDPVEAQQDRVYCRWQAGQTQEGTGMGLHFEFS